MHWGHWVALLKQRSRASSPGSVPPSRQDEDSARRSPSCRCYGRPFVRRFNVDSSGASGPHCASRQFLKNVHPVTHLVRRVAARCQAAPAIARAGAGVGCKCFLSARHSREPRLDGWAAPVPGADKKLHAASIVMATTYRAQRVRISTAKPQAQAVAATVSLSSSIMRSRMTNFCTLPVTVIGISETKRI